MWWPFKRKPKKEPVESPQASISIQSGPKAKALMGYHHRCARCEKWFHNDAEYLAHSCPKRFGLKPTQQLDRRRH